jgi:hypothetical protein
MPKAATFSHVADLLLFFGLAFYLPLLEVPTLLLAFIVPYGHYFR